MNLLARGTCRQIFLLARQEFWSSGRFGTEMRNIRHSPDYYVIPVVWGTCNTKDVPTFWGQQLCVASIYMPGCYDTFVIPTDHYIWIQR